MRKATLFMVLVLATLSARSALATETSAAAPEQPAQTAPATPETVLPAEITGQLTPKPAYKYGIMNGPCEVSVVCSGNCTIRCWGESVCKWKEDNTSSIYTRGFVECDGYRIGCESGIGCPGPVEVE